MRYTRMIGFQNTDLLILMYSSFAFSGYLLLNTCTKYIARRTKITTTAVVVTIPPRFESYFCAHSCTFFLGNASNLSIPFVFSMTTLRFTGTLTPENFSIVSNNCMVMKNGQIARINFFRKNYAIRIKINVKVTVFYTVSPSL